MGSSSNSNIKYDKEEIKDFNKLCYDINKI